MTKIKVFNYNRDKYVEVEVEHVSDTEYIKIKQHFIGLLTEKQAYDAIANAFVFAVKVCPKANPSDVWQHIIYRTFIETGRNEQSWKRASGQGFEWALAKIYNPILAKYNIRLVVLGKNNAMKALKEMNLEKIIEPSKMDIAVEGNCTTGKEDWKIFGVIHAKTSIAERIKDDAPASREIMQKGFLSAAVTLDSKSFPPPHGDGINHGELGGRTIASGLKPGQPKRNYFEKDGDFTNGYSYNLRTPESPAETPSGSRIKTLPLTGHQPDVFVNDLVSFWQKSKQSICKKVKSNVLD